MAKKKKSFLSGVLLEWIMNMKRKTRFNDFLDSNDSQIIKISGIESDGGLSKITVWRLTWDPEKVTSLLSCFLVYFLTLMIGGCDKLPKSKFQILTTTTVLYCQK